MFLFFPFSIMKYCLARGDSKLCELPPRVIWKTVNSDKISYFSKILVSNTFKTLKSFQTYPSWTISYIRMLPYCHKQSRYKIKKKLTNTFVLLLGKEQDVLQFSFPIFLLYSTESTRSVIPWFIARINFFKSCYVVFLIVSAYIFLCRIFNYEKCPETNKIFDSFICIMLNGRVKRWEWRAERLAQPQTYTNF